MGGASLFAAAKAHSRCIRARESPPPDTATARGERACPAMAWAKFSSSSAASFLKETTDGLLAAGCFAHGRGAGEGLRRGVGVFRLDETKRGAAFRLLAQRHEGLGQFEHSVRRAL